MTRMGALRLPPSMEALALAWDWWDKINESTRWQDGIFYSLCGAYALVAAVALIQLVRIELRVPEYGWTTQKVFHLMNFVVNGVRALVFAFHTQVFALHPKVLTFVLLDLPGLLFFSTYTLLVLFWAEIYHQARSLPSDKLKIFYISINGAMYFIQVCIWIYLWIDDNSVVEFIEKIFIAVISIIAALGFLLYGGRLFAMLRRFPIESKGRRKKLHEVGFVTAICFTCFIIRCSVLAYGNSKISCYLENIEKKINTLVGIKHSLSVYSQLVMRESRQLSTQIGDFLALGILLCPLGWDDVNFFPTCMVLLSAFDSDASLDVLDHPILNMLYYMLVEILPSALVLYILRKLPPKRISAQHHAIR